MKRLVIMFAVLNLLVIILSSCATTPQETFSFTEKGIKLTSEPSGAHVAIKIISTIEGEVKDHYSLDYVTPYYDPEGHFPTHAWSGNVEGRGDLLMTTKYYIAVSKPGYKEIVIAVDGSEMKSVWHWNLEPIEKSTPKVDIPGAEKPGTKGPAPIGGGIGGFPCAGDSTGLIRAIKGGADKVKSLLDSGVHPDQRDQNCYTPLIWAGGQGDYEIVKLLLDKGADINAVNRDAHSALTYTVLNLALGLFEGRHIDVIKLLIERGAYINWKSLDGTALKIAEDFNLKEAGDILKKAGAKK